MVVDRWCGRSTAAENLSISVPSCQQIAAEARVRRPEEMEAIKRGYQENAGILIRRPAERRPHQIPVRPMARSISMPTSRNFTSGPVTSSPAGCWKRPTSQPPGPATFRSNTRQQLHRFSTRDCVGRRDARSRRAHRRAGSASAHTETRETLIRRYGVVPSERCPGPLYPRHFRSPPCVAAACRRNLDCAAQLIISCAGNRDCDFRQGQMPLPYVR